MATTWYEARVVGIESINAHTKRFFLELPDIERFDFQAGQFITMDLPIHEKRLHRWRSYSIASAPNGSNLIELCIVRLEGGRATQYLFETIQPGSTIRLKGPGGAFVLPNIADKDLVLLCTGTGVAPFRSMLLDLKQTQKPHRNIHLIFGTRFRDGILYQEEFVNLHNEMPGFRYAVALSREEPANLQGLPFEAHTGYIHAFYEEAYREVREDIVFMLCGWSNMVDEAQKKLIQEMGYAPGQVLTELYG